MFFFHLNVSFRLGSYATEAFEIDILSLSSFPSLFFFPYFSFATSRYTILLGCCFYFARKQGVFYPLFIPPSAPHITYPWLSNPSSSRLQTVLLNYVWPTVKVWLFLVAVSHKNSQDFENVDEESAVREIQKGSKNVLKIDRMRIHFNAEESPVIFRSPPHFTSICQIYSSAHGDRRIDISVINSLWHLRYL